MDNLSKMAMYAREENMSYGKYMAMRHDREERRRMNKETINTEKERNGYIKCTFCGSYFYPNRGAHKYCSEKCKKRARG